MSNIAGVKDTVLQLTALCGEISAEALRQLNCSEKYLDNVLLKLRQENLISQCKKDDMVGYRLTRNGKNLLSLSQPERFADFFAGGIGTDKVRLDAAHRYRYMRMSEILVMLYGLGVHIFPDEKAPLFSPLAVESQSSQPRYYLSSEVKNFGDESIKINNARFTGLLRAGTGDYLMYNTGESVLKWEEMSEYRSVTLLEYKLKTKIHPIMCGMDMETAGILLSSDGGKLSKYYKVGSALPCMHFVPRNEDGRFLLSMYVLSRNLQHLKESVLKKQNLYESNTSLQCDGYANDTTAVLFACDFDMQRIALFKTGTEVRGLKKIVFCFDFQADVLSRYFGSNTELRVIDAHKTAELCGIRYGGR